MKFMIEAAAADNGVPCFLYREKLSHEKLSLVTFWFALPECSLVQQVLDKP